MPVITRKLLRKRAEHNEGMLSTLQEISLHQEELESINEVLGMTCRKIRILYLQNNIIPKMENLFHLKDLSYLNLALNNISKIEGLQNCEFLAKLDLTINFVDFDTLKESIEHLVPLTKLQELYMMGNPATTWDKFNSYVIAKLPQLTTIDGTSITRSMQIVARQSLPKLEEELEVKAAEVRKEKALKAVENPVAIQTINKVTTGDVTVEDDDEEGDPNEMTDNTPETRIKIYKELAQQKKEKEDRERANLPKERDYEAEHKKNLEEVRKKEEDTGESEIKQKNEGGWEFFWDEETQPGKVILDVRVARFLDSSLIDVDIHPTYVSVVIKGKVLRLRLPAEVKVSESKCQRSKTTGSLMIIMPKVDPKANAVTIRADIKAKQHGALGSNSGRTSSTTVKVSTTLPKKMTFQEQMMMEALNAAKLSDENTGKQEGSNQLLDSEIGTSKSRINLADIVKKPKEHPSVFRIDEDHENFPTSSKVVEL